MERWRGWKGGEGGTPEYLNTDDKHHRQATQVERQLTGGANLAPPQGWSGRGGGSYPLHNARYENRK